MLRADLRILAYSYIVYPTLLLRPEQVRYLQIQLFWVGHVPDLAKRLTRARGDDDER
jgi:hypothetical protein